MRSVGWKSSEKGKHVIGEINSKQRGFYVVRDKASRMFTIHQTVTHGCQMSMPILDNRKYFFLFSTER